MRIHRLATPVLMLATVLLGGCADWERHMQSRLPEPQPALADKQITVSPTRSVHEIAFADRQAQIPANEQAYLANFLSTTVVDPDVAVMVETPGRRSDRLTRQRAEAVVAWLGREGFHVHRYDAGEGEPGKIRVAVDHLMAMAPDCPNWQFHKYYEFGSQPSPNFGCADRSNLAAMVANPRDLVTGQVPAARGGHAALYGETRYRADAPRALQDAGDISSN